MPECSSFKSRLQAASAESVSVMQIAEMTGAKIDELKALIQEHK